MPLNHILRKCIVGYKLSKSQEKLNRRMYMDEIKLFAKNDKELKPQSHSQNIGMALGREKCTMLVMKSGKRYLTDRMELPKQDKERLEKRKPTNTWGYWKLTPSDKRK